MELVVENKAKFEELRAKYPDFTYDSYSWALNDTVLTLSFIFTFSEGDSITVSQKLKLPYTVSEETIERHEDFIFRIGLIEALSYWKAQCSPNFHINCGTLSEDEIAWWVETWYDGLGEFRYRNGLLSVKKENWVEFFFDKPKKHAPKISHDFSELSGSLVAFTGGKDSTLALGLMKDKGEKIETFFVKAHGPKREEIKEVLGLTDIKETVVERNMHPHLLKLNEEGALNGHTPFSIVVAFLGMLSASLRGKKYFIVANEASSDAPTVPGTDINHQYSKSLHFERRFQKLSQMLWPDGPMYFSILRPFSEIGIAALLKKYEDAMPYISSCNTKNKEGAWCGECAKCLFAFMLISAEWDIAFAERLFGTNMFMHTRHLQNLLELTGIAVTRPFECVGTTQESLAILSHILVRFPEAKAMPLISVFLSKNIHMLLPPEIYKMILCEFHDHLIPDAGIIEYLEKVQDEVCYG